MLRLGYVNQCHEERATATPGVVGPDSAGDSSGTPGRGGGVRAAHCRLGGTGGGVAGTAQADFAELLAPALVGGAAGEAQAAARALGAPAWGPAGASALSTCAGASGRGGGSHSLHAHALPPLWGGLAGHGSSAPP